MPIITLDRQDVPLVVCARRACLNAAVTVGVHDAHEHDEDIPQQARHRWQTLSSL